MSTKALALLRSQSTEYQEYIKLKRYVDTQKKKLYKNMLTEHGSKMYYIYHDKCKELKHKLREEGLIND